MKFIKQKSTGKIVFREEPHGDDAKVLGNASIMRGIDVSDLEVVEESYTDDQWNAALFDEKSYSEKREGKYPSWQDQMDDLFHNGVEGWKASIKLIKEKYPKPE